MKKKPVRGVDYEVVEDDEDGDNEDFSDDEECNEE